MEKCFESFKSMEIMSDICDLKKRLLSVAKSEVDRDITNVDAKELGEVVDMVKDLAQAEASCYEACYYKTVTAAMEERGSELEDEEMTRWGYNTHHYNNGRFAPSGRGHIVGYNPTMHQMPYVDGYLNNPDFVSDMKRMGYDNMSGRGNGLDNNMTGYGETRRSGYMHDWDMNADDMTDWRYGKSYGDYLRARKHYTTSQSSADKEKMEMHANEHMADTMNTIKEIYRTADPDQKKRLKNDLTKLVGEMA